MALGFKRKSSEGGAGLSKDYKAHLKHAPFAYMWAAALPPRLYSSLRETGVANHSLDDRVLRQGAITGLFQI